MPFNDSGAGMKICRYGLRLLRGIVFLLIFSTAFAQEEGPVSPFCYDGTIFRSGIYVINDGVLDVNNTYEENLPEGHVIFDYSMSASAESGHSVVYNSVSSVPTASLGDRLIRTGTILGYSAQGTGGSLDGTEYINAITCGDGGSTGLNAGVQYSIVEGTINTSSHTRSSPAISQFSAMAVGTGTLSTGITTVSSSFAGDNNGDNVETSSSNYNQSITVSGEISGFRQKTRVSLSGGAGCGIW